MSVYVVKIDSDIADAEYHHIIAILEPYRRGKEFFMDTERVFVIECVGEIVEGLKAQLIAAAPDLAKESVMPPLEIIERSDEAVASVCEECAAAYRNYWRGEAMVLAARS